MMGKLIGKIRADGWKMVQFFIFLALAGWFFTRSTYLFRNTSYDRAHVVGIQKEGELDVVCVGGSSTFVYWMPYLAWKEYGMASYNLATNSANAPVVCGYAKYLLGMQKPDLVVIDVRGFLGGLGTLAGDEGPIRNMTDSLPLSAGRLQIITDTFHYYDAFQDSGDVDLLSFYFDIAKYHGSYNRLGSEINWEYRKNDLESEYSGFEFIDAHAVVPKSEGFQTTKRAALDSANESCLKDLLEFLVEKDQQALFVLGPYQISQEDEMRCNTMRETVSLYGYGLLNTNDFYDKMDIDFSKDLYNGGHVDVFGAEKYTRFTADYIKKHYHIQDHRGDTSYQKWEDKYTAAKERERETKKIINQMVSDKKRANKAGHRLKGMEGDFSKWCKAASDANYTVVALSKGKVPDIPVYTPWNLTGDRHGFIRIYFGNSLSYENNGALDVAYECSLGTYGSCQINCGRKIKLAVDGKEYKTDRNGIYLLVFDNNYNEVLDVVYVSGKKEDAYKWKHIH